MHGPTCIFWASLRPLSRVVNASRAEVSFSRAAAGLTRPAARAPGQARDAVFECCGCTHSSLSNRLNNRVVQRGIKHNIEVFMTPTAGWGVRCWNEIPAGSFIATYGPGPPWAVKRPQRFP